MATLSPNLTPELAALAAGLTAKLNGISASRYTNVAGYVVVLYDWLLTLDDEVEFIWPAPWSLVKILYLINRSVAPIFLTVIQYHLAGFRGPVTDLFCKLHIAIAGVAQFSSTLAGTSLLCLRLGALYSNNRKFMTPLWVFLYLSYACSAVFMILTLLKFLKDVHYSPVAKVCALEEHFKLMNGIFYAPIVFEVIVIVLTVWKGIEHARFLNHASNAPVLFTLYRDGLLYFVVIVGLRVWNATIWATLDESYIYLGLYFLWASIAMLISRLFLNLRKASTSNADWLTANVPRPGATAFSTNRDTSTSITHRTWGMGDDVIIRGQQRLPGNLNLLKGADTIEMEHTPDSRTEFQPWSLA